MCRDDRRPWSVEGVENDYVSSQEEYDEHCASQALLRLSGESEEEPEQIDTLVAARESPARDSILPSRQTQRKERAKTACLACRRDNKRCGNAHPCSRCLDKKEDCIRIEQERKAVKKRCQACRINKRKCADKRPCPRCVEEATECIDLARKGTGRGNRVKWACAQCRRGKAQCTNERPCKTCVRRGFECDSDQVEIGSNVQGPDSEAGTSRDRPEGQTETDADMMTAQSRSESGSRSSVEMDVGVGIAFPGTEQSASAAEGREQTPRQVAPEDSVFSVLNRAALSVGFRIVSVRLRSDGSQLRARVG